MPYKNDVGWREIPRSEKQVRKMLHKMSQEAERGVKVDKQQLDELLNLVNFANDGREPIVLLLVQTCVVTFFLAECDPGMGLQLGINMFSSAEHKVYYSLARLLLLL